MDGGAALARPTRTTAFRTDEREHGALVGPAIGTVAWVNARSRVYHFAGTRNNGNTKQGAYMCEADARTAGDRAAMNEHHP